MSRTPMAPIPVLARLLRVVSSRDAANAAIGDILEELAERTAAGRTPRAARLWVNLQTVRATGSAILAAVPRLIRSSGLTLRDAIRGLRAAPAHSLFVVLVLGVGITAGTVTFSVVDAVLLKPLPLEQPEQLVTISARDQAGQERITADVYWRLHDELQSVDALATRTMMVGTTVRAGPLTDEWPVTFASSSLFRVLRWSPAIGRFWTADDEARGETDVAVLGYRLWREQFNGDASILGETVSWGQWTFRVIGVLPAGSDHPELYMESTPIWVPNVARRTGSVDAGIVARMRPGVTAAQVGLGAAALVVLVACVNAANLMLTHSAKRAQEMAIRASLGASRSRIAAAVLTEGFLLALGATACALLCSVWGIGVARAAIGMTLPWLFRASTITLNGRVLAAAAAAAAVTGLMVSLVPAWQTARVPVSRQLQDHEGTTAAGRWRWRGVFLTAEIATVVVLLVVTWLFVGSLIRAFGIDVGIDRTSLLAINPRLEFRGTVDEVQQRLERLPGVSDVAVSAGASLPLIGRVSSGAWSTTELRRADAVGVDSPISALEYHVTSNYFDVAGLPFRRGGTWAPDAARSEPVVVLDERVARQLFGDDDPLGRQIRARIGRNSEQVFTVVGTVAYVYVYGPEGDAPPSAYFPLVPNPTRTFAGLFVKTSRPPDEMLPLVTEALAPLAPPTRDPFVFAADEAMRQLTATRRFLAGLMSAFGIVGMLIGAAGVYAVMASLVAQQTRELGLRMALGAAPARIRREVLARAWRHLLAGLVLGVPVAWWLSQGFASLLFEISPADASVYAGVAVLLIGVGLMAAWIPARRAARLDPIISLRR